MKITGVFGRRVVAQEGHSVGRDGGRHRRLLVAVVPLALGLVAGYAFETLNLHKLYLRVVAFNKRALALYRAVGFVEEGIQRQQAFVRGRYCDVVLMGLIRSRRGRPT